MLIAVLHVLFTGKAGCLPSTNMLLQLSSLLFLPPIFYPRRLRVGMHSSELHQMLKLNHSIVSDQFAECSNIYESNFEEEADDKPLAIRSNAVEK